MEKLIYLLGDAEAESIPVARHDLRAALLAAGPDLMAAGARKLSFYVADVEDPGLAGVAQFNRAGLLDGVLSLWVDTLDERAGIETIVSKLASRHAGYLVTESILRGYSGLDPDVVAKPEVGVGQSSPAGTWSFGEASPGIALVTTFPKPDWIDDETFYARWHDSHGPLSLELHPLTRYVRNTVARGLTPGSPPFRGIVSESVESVAVAADVDRFYGGRAGRKRIVEDLLSFAEIATMSTVVMHEYILEV